MQIAPLVLALLAINAMLHLLSISNNVAEVQGFHILLLNLMPCLFASGAGALLVSQEKEHRTIGWLNSLPIAPGQILYAKLFIGLVGLAIIWILCLLTTLIFDRELPRELVFPQDGGFPVQIAAINSAFLLLLGFATAWRWQSTLVSLVMIVPLGALPTVAVMTMQGLSRENRLSDLWVGLVYLLFSGVFLWYGWRSGSSYLTSKPQWLARRTLNLLNRFERAGSRGNMLSAKSQSPASTLIWQFSVQNRMLLVALVSLFVLPALVILLQSSSGVLAMVAIPAWLVVSWLGASVFQSDSVHQRVKFLAERGVAPRTIWWTRQILPLGLILIATAISAILGMAILNGSHAKYVSYGNYMVFPWLMLGGPAVLLAHAAAQWQGQLIRSSIVSLIIAPAITLAAISYAGFAMVTFGTPYWMVFVPSLVAFIATRVMTGPWMDGRTGKKYWFGHALFLAAALSIPALPFVVTAALYPGMPNSGYKQFAAELIKYGRPGDSIELVLTASLSPGSEAESGETGEIMGELEGMGITGAAIAVEETDGEQPIVGFVEQIKFNLVSIEEQLAHRSGAVRWSPAVSFVAAEAMLTRAQLDVDSKNEPSRDRYRTAMRILHEVLIRMRKSGRLFDQEGADRVERWMFEQVELTDAREMLGESNWTAITKTLIDKAGRKEARRRAIVQSWSQLSISGMTAISSTGLAGLRGNVADSRRISRAYWLQLQYLESKDPSEAGIRFAEVASAWGLPANRNRQGSLSHETGIEIPGQNWFGEWENFSLDEQGK